MANENAAITGCREQRVTLLEVILDVCAETFSEGACTATGEPCYNHWNGCRDQCNFNCSTKSYWFTTCIVPAHLATQYTPNIREVSSNPTTIALGKTFSTRGKITVVFDDSEHNDRGFDPYIEERFPNAIPICPEDVPGTLFGRWIERVKYFENRRANVYHGYCDQPLCEFVKESYFIDAVSGPTAAGRVTFTLKDPLILADDSNAKCPRAEDKIVATQIAGNEFARPFTLGLALDGPVESVAEGETPAAPFAAVNGFLSRNNYLLGDPAQDACFARLRHVCVGEEVMEVRAEVNNATPRGWNIKLLDRAVCGSELKQHDEGAAITLAETFAAGTHVADVVCRLLTECSEIQDVAVQCCEDTEESLIDFDSFEAFRCAAPLSFTGEVIICKPVGLTTLLNELSEQFLFFLYFDSSVGKIRIQNFAPPECDSVIPIIEFCSMVKSSVERRKTDDRYNQINFFNSVTNCGKSLSEENLSDVVVTVTADALREACDRREYKTKKIKTIRSRWVTKKNRYVAAANGERWLRIRRCPAERATISLSFEEGRCFGMGTFARLHHPSIQSPSGGYAEYYWLLTGRNVNGDCIELSFERTDFDGTLAPCLNCDTACPTLIVNSEECSTDECTGIW